MESTVEYDSHGCEIDEGWTIHGGGGGGGGSWREWNNEGSYHGNSNLKYDRICP